MIRSSPLTQLGKLAAKEFVANTYGSASQEAAEYMDDEPAAVLDVIDLIVAESRKKKPNENLVSAYAFMLGHGLDGVRMQIEGGLGAGERIKAAAVDKLLRLGRGGTVDPAVLMVILSQFSGAKLDMGDDLRAMLADCIQDMPPPGEHGVNRDGREVERHFAEVVTAAKGDLFILQQQMVERADVFPPDSRASMALAMLQSDQPLIREASIGWLLDRNSLVRTSVAEAIVNLNPPARISGSMLRRMIALRNWLPAEDRPALDAAIRTCRQREVACASWPSGEVVKALATGIDGGGAQSLFLVAKEKRKYAIVGLLLKHDVGIRDAWVNHGLSRSNVDDFLEDLPLDADFFHTSLDYLHASTAHLLATGVATGTLPPFMFFDLAETIGVSDLNPAAMEVERLVADLCEQVDDGILKPRAVTRVIKTIDHWHAEFAFMETWFENDDVVRKQIAEAGVGAAGEPAFILSTVLPQRRRRWAELIAWTAYTLKQDGDEPYWEEFAVTARELLSDRDIADFAIMKAIAETTSAALRDADG